MENRAFPRVVLDVQVTITVPEGACSAHCINISAGGIAVSTTELKALAPADRSVYELLPHGRLVRCDLQLPDQGAFSCTARVRWAVGVERFGGEFVEVDDPSRAALVAYLAAHVAP